MPGPTFGPCQPFATEADLCCLAASGEFPDPCLADGKPLPANAVENALQAASEILWAATGRRFGGCTVTLRPCRQTCNPCPGMDFYNAGDFRYGSGMAWTPYLLDGVWYNLPLCGCPGQCGCSSLCEIELPYPVSGIVEVKIDGDTLPSTEYRVDEYRTLVRTPAVEGDCWPACQDLSLPDTEVGTFSITVSYGRTVPGSLTMATAELACQLLKSCVGAPCQLPQRVSSITRQGVTMGFIDPQEFLVDGRTGIYIVDIVIQQLNPNHLTRRPAIWSPDAGPKWRRTNT
jgi:hypothetical protein